MTGLICSYSYVAQVTVLKCTALGCFCCWAMPVNINQWAFPWTGLVLLYVCSPWFSSIAHKLQAPFCCPYWSVFFMLEEKLVHQFTQKRPFRQINQQIKKVSKSADKGNLDQKVYSRDTIRNISNILRYLRIRSRRYDTWLNIGRFVLSAVRVPAMREARFLMRGAHVWQYTPNFSK